LKQKSLIPAKPVLACYRKSKDTVVRVKKAVKVDLRFARLAQLLFLQKDGVSADIDKHLCQFCSRNLESALGCVGCQQQENAAATVAFMEDIAINWQLLLRTTTSYPGCNLSLSVLEQKLRHLQWYLLTPLECQLVLYSFHLPIPVPTPVFSSDPRKNAADLPNTTLINSSRDNCGNGKSCGRTDSCESRAAVEIVDSAGAVATAISVASLTAVAK
jgi:hypothetical protein